MGAVYEEFEQQLAGWKLKYAGRPRQEITHLLYLSLEREGLVSMAYREDLMLRRLSAAPLPEEVRDLIHHALLWAWKDEEMHTIYLRGALLKVGNLPRKAAAFLHQGAGLTGGWASSVQQHVRWREAPLSRTLAGLVTTTGALMGQVPKEVSEYLCYRPFRDFCQFNVDAENTAWLCYERLLELAREQPTCFPAPIDDFVRIQADEERHGRIFELIRVALDERDGLVEGESAETLAAKIGAVGEHFLPRSRRRVTLDEHPVGSGGAVHVAEGAALEAKLPCFRGLLDAVGLRAQLEKRARILGKPVSELRVAIKPTFMLGYHQKDRSPITDPELLGELAAALRELGCGDLAVVEAPNIYDRFYRNRSVAEVARYLGIESPYFRVVDLSAEQEPYAYARGLAQYCVGRTWRDADFRISFGKLRSHPVEGVSLAIGNLEGAGARCDEFFFAERQAHRDTALMMLLDAFPPHLSLVDGYAEAPDGLVGIMGCPRPKTPLRLYGGVDPLAVDMTAARHLGLPEPRRSTFIQAACHWFGDPSALLTVTGPDVPVKGWRDPYHNEWATLLSLLAMPIYRFGSCRGALFVPEMDEEAFPLIEHEGARLRMARRWVQALLGLRFPKGSS